MQVLLDLFVLVLAHDQMGYRLPMVFGSDRLFNAKKILVAFPQLMNICSLPFLVFKPEFVEGAATAPCCCKT